MLNFFGLYFLVTSQLPHLLRFLRFFIIHDLALWPPFIFLNKPVFPVLAYSRVPNKRIDTFIFKDFFQADTLIRDMRVTMLLMHRSL